MPPSFDLRYRGYGDTALNPDGGHFPITVTLYSIPNSTIFLSVGMSENADAPSSARGRFDISVAGKFIAEKQKVS
jgi:hypothetical protein